MPGPKKAADFIAEFREIVGAAPRLEGDLAEAVERVITYLRDKKIRPLTSRRREFLAHTNWKFRINADALGAFYGAAAALGYTFHFHFKKDIERAFDLRDQSLWLATLSEKGLEPLAIKKLTALFTPAPESTTLDFIRSECGAPSRLRKEVGDRDVAQEILSTLFAAFMWTSLSQREMHAHFDPRHDPKRYQESFWDELHRRKPELFNRAQALHVVRIPARERVAKKADAASIACNAIAELYERINNYGFLAVLIEHTASSDEWELAARLTLFAEKHREAPLNKGYFRWEAVRDETLAHVPVSDPKAASFELCNEGFTYRDCFVIAKADLSVRALLLVFQKNERDETLIACPACRSEDVQGNSYPTLGVRSWECNNVLCPERSKYNRGKRYSFKGLVMQQAIEDPRSEVPVESVRAWSRDVVEASDDDVKDMLVRHYSMFGDTVHVHDWASFGREHLGRSVKHHELGVDTETPAFWTGPFFHRYAHRAKKTKRSGEVIRERGLTVHVGDAAEVLRNTRANQLDGAVTSPPYYNAREYAQWPNMYCHLHDMFDVNAEVFRVLKPGALYLYNVFDYFDNERTIVFSAMGQRRVLLSAYTVDLFRRIGFESLGAVVWDKGEIEGKRGNFSPYYQAPFNCWEHVLVFQKPGPSVAPSVSRVLRQKPVIKMVRGENVHGHSAPYPDAIPELLLDLMPRRGTVLDPFAGSLTTGRAALRRGFEALCIERSAEYVDLGLRMLRQDRR